MSNDNRLAQLTAAGVAVWLDFVSRDFLKKGGLAQLVENDGLTGVTSNPSIFEKAMGHGTDYDASLNALLDAGDIDASTLYEKLAVQDIQAAADTLRPVYDKLAGRDGYVSLEVSPFLANDTDATLAEARRLWRAVDRPNLMIKVPGTEAGARAVRQLIEEGVNVNITLLFSRTAYQAVAQAYIEGLSARVAAGHDISRIASVASFFVSRIDAQIDKKIDEKLAGATAADQTVLTSLKGKVAIANAKLAYQDYLALIQTPAWKALAAKGAQVQRLLWASTGTKNPAYPKTLYVDQLIGADTVNTVPPATLEAFRESGTVAPTLTQDVEGARKVLAETERLGLDLAGVTRALVEDGAQQFADAADALIAAVAAKRVQRLGDKLDGVSYALPADLAADVAARAETARAQGWARRLWAADATLWTNHDEASWLGWLAAGQGRQVDAAAVMKMAGEVRADGYTDAVLLGMGGSSLGPEVLAETLGSAKPGLRLHVLDSTDPAQIAAVEKSLDLSKTLFIVSSKSGSTLEPEILRAYFHAASAAVVGEKNVGRHFIAVTDPGSKLETQARALGFRAVFLGDTHIGGRSSVLSVFGMVPLAVLGHDIDAFFAATQPMVRACGPLAPPAANPGVYLGLVLGAAAVAGRDKLTFFTSPGLASIGSWLEQLLAESTGKQGLGIIPVDHEPIGAPGVYGADRVFVHLRVAKDAVTDLDAKVEALAAAGHPVVRITLRDGGLIGQEFFRWEVATAIAGAVIGINPFDQPDVEASKIKTRALTDAYEQSGKLEAETPFAEDGDLAFYGDATLRGDGSAAAIVRAHLARLKPNDYAGLLAYIQRNEAHEALLKSARSAIRDHGRVATVVGFGPRFLHSTGQAYKGGPNSGVFLQITAQPEKDLPIAGRKISFGVVEAAQARGDLGVLVERGRRTLRIHIKQGGIDAGLAHIVQLVRDALA
jgi:transaldolase/glucose-6-phosphate isomerase